jgi:hypothetical protein
MVVLPIPRTDRKGLSARCSGQPKTQKQRHWWQELILFSSCG